MEVAAQEKKKSRKEIRRHLKEKVVEKGETNREKLEWIRLQDALLYFHLIGKNAKCWILFTFSLSGKLRRSTAS